MSAQFRHGTAFAEAEGFYDANGSWLIRFMPTEEGTWTYITSSSHPDLNGIGGTFECTTASPENHGPVRIGDAVHFQYADGTRFIPFGTNCYEWHRQSDRLQEQTLNSLQRSPFNKVRMLILPRQYHLLLEGKVLEPFERMSSKDRDLDWMRPCPDYYTHLEQRVQQLAAIGIEAELLLFHPGGEAGYGCELIPPEAAELYLRYVIARFGAYRNVWWSLGYEAEAMEEKTPEDWHRLGRWVQELDCGAHLRSIQHTGSRFDYGAHWITHVSLRTPEVRIASECAKQFGKPVVMEECGCEGNLESRWGSLTAEEIVSRLWEGYFRGGYAAYCESYVREDTPLWHEQGGELKGESIPRIQFLRELLYEAPESMAYSSGRLDAATLEIRGAYYLQYFGPHQFAYREFALPEGKYKADVIDTWNLTVTPLQESFEGRFRIELPGRLYYALRLRKVSEHS
ncbi:hypothetical protein CF651_02455 [Paenibacillus rigui]|uniref:DUF5060 domain-containing protein n=1 Tax=Paenibacillus rigui TaxID=554312 RepID=A0A229UXV2_9BACL|nr:hypothetical protein CF651_02455 [Paenibacillus rigui]